MNYKIRVANEAESKEAQELLQSLGWVSHIEGLSGITHIFAIKGMALSWLSDVCDDYFNKDSCKETTLPQLRDLVVLKRNSIDDATHINLRTNTPYLVQGDKEYYMSDKEWFLLECPNDLKPIEKPMKDHMLQVKEWLDPNDNYSYHKCAVIAQGSGWIEIPEGAEVATSAEAIYFWNTKNNTTYVDGEGWVKSDGENLCTLDEYLTETNYQIVWKRETLIDKLASAEVDRQSDKVFGEILEGGFEGSDAFIESNVEQDNVNQPSHYCSHPSGIECIEITRHHDFTIGNAIKYLWRAGLKDSADEIQDLEKASWYIQDKINQLKKLNGNP